VRAAALCHHVLSGVDLKRSGARFALLEANASPLYLDIEQKTGAPITADAIARRAC
jgi:glutathione synthase/RimK-type ligase-like ATP-grasp enzyme